MKVVYIEWRDRVHNLRDESSSLSTLTVLSYSISKGLRNSLIKVLEYSIITLNLILNFSCQIHHEKST